MGKWIIVLGLMFSTYLDAEIKVLAFSGSTREGSVNKKLVEEASSLARQIGAQVTLINLKDYPMPFYDGDYETKEGLPPKAKELRQMMINSSVIFIASPEYNGSLSATLKNVIDWASRSEEKGGTREAFQGKKFALMSASPGSNGGKRGLVHLKAIIENIGGQVINEQVVVPDAYTAFDDKGHLKNKNSQLDLQQLVQAAINKKIN